MWSFFLKVFFFVFVILSNRNCGSEVTRCHHYNLSVVHIVDENLTVVLFGNLIHPQWVISTAYRIYDIYNSSHLFVLGYGIFAYTLEYIPVKETYIHPLLNNETFNNSFAIHKLVGKYPMHLAYAGIGGGDLVEAYKKNEIEAWFSNPLDKPLYEAVCHSTKFSNDTYKVHDHKDCIGCCTAGYLIKIHAAAGNADAPYPTHQYAFCSSYNMAYLLSLDLGGAPILSGNYIFGLTIVDHCKHFNDARDKMTGTGFWYIDLSQALPFYQQVLKKNGLELKQVKVYGKYTGYRLPIEPSSSTQNDLILILFLCTFVVLFFI